MRSEDILIGAFESLKSYLIYWSEDGNVNDVMFILASLDYEGFVKMLWEHGIITAVERDYLLKKRPIFAEEFLDEVMYE